MAEQCGVSRNAVWKAIKDLREKGYDIEAVSNKGYKLYETSDIISAEGIRAGLPEKLRQTDIYVFSSLGSTSDKAKALAMKDSCLFLDKYTDSGSFYASDICCIFRIAASRR